MEGTCNDKDKRICEKYLLVTLAFHRKFEIILENEVFNKEGY